MVVMSVTTAIILRCFYIIISFTRLARANLYSLTLAGWDYLGLTQEASSLSKSITQQFQWRARSTDEKDVEVKVKRARKSPPEASFDAAKISGYCMEFLVRKLFLDKLAHEPCDIDWASITVTEFARYCPDQAHALDSCPTEWSVEDL